MTNKKIAFSWNDPRKMTHKELLEDYLKYREPLFLESGIESLKAEILELKVAVRYLSMGDD